MDLSCVGKIYLKHYISLFLVNTNCKKELKIFGNLSVNEIINI